MRFSSTRYSVGDRVVVTLTPVGEIDLLTAGALRAAIEDTLNAPGPVNVLVDLARVTFLDCAGIGALVAGHNIAIRRGRGYTVVNPQRRVRRVLELAGVLEELTHLPQSAPSTSRPARSPQLGRRRLDQWAELASPAAAELSHVRVAGARRWPAAAVRRSPHGRSRQNIHGGRGHRLSNSAPAARSDKAGRRRRHLIRLSRKAADRAWRVAQAAGRE
ncbi:STAS domain-containing protein [Nonomuraea sp. NPDC049269]|uniref:STAS domain-containing protein n=1 Tax=Nonomuraea sp. NPDC049269 TaxID=3364349 RepID=UPI00371A234A